MHMWPRTCSTCCYCIKPDQWRSQPKKLGGGKMFDFRRITLFCLVKRFSKHKMTICSKNWGGLGPPGYAYEPDCRSPRNWSQTYAACVLEIQTKVVFYFTWSNSLSPAWKSCKVASTTTQKNNDVIHRRRVWNFSWRAKSVTSRRYTSNFYVVIVSLTVIHINRYDFGFKRPLFVQSCRLCSRVDWFKSNIKN